MIRDWHQILFTLEVECGVYTRRRTDQQADERSSIHTIVSIKTKLLPPVGDTVRLPRWKAVAIAENGVGQMHHDAESTRIYLVL